MSSTFFLGRHGDLGLGRQPEAALREDLRVGVADGLVDGLRHHRAAIDLLEMAHRHLAGTEAVERTLSLRSTSLASALASRSDAGNADLEFVLQSLGEGFCDLHGVNLLPASSGLTAGHCQSVRRAALKPASVVRRTKSFRGNLPFGNRSSSIRHANAVSAWCGRRDSNPHNFRHWNLNPARLPVPPRPLIASCPAAMPRAAGL
jgi:hypothetical protein